MNNGKNYWVKSFYKNELVHLMHCNNGMGNKSLVPEPKFNHNQSKWLFKDWIIYDTDSFSTAFIDYTGDIFKRLRIVGNQYIEVKPEGEKSKEVVLKVETYYKDLLIYVDESFSVNSYNYSKPTYCENKKLWEYEGMPLRFPDRFKMVFTNKVTGKEAFTYGIYEGKYQILPVKIVKPFKKLILRRGNGKKKYRIETYYCNTRINGQLFCNSLDENDYPRPKYSETSNLWTFEDVLIPYPDTFKTEFVEMATGKIKAVYVIRDNVYQLFDQVEIDKQSMFKEIWPSHNTSKEAIDLITEERKLWGVVVMEDNHTKCLKCDGTGYLEKDKQVDVPEESCVIFNNKKL